MSDEDSWLRKLAKRAVELKDKTVEYPASKVEKATTKKDLDNEIAIAKAKQEADKFAIPKAAWAVQNVPGMQTLNKLAFGRRPPEDAGEMDTPVRQPIQMEREFSNEKDKEAYIERVREALKKAKK